MPVVVTHLARKKLERGHQMDKPLMESIFDLTDEATHTKIGALICTAMTSMERDEKSALDIAIDRVNGKIIINWVVLDET